MLTSGLLVTGVILLRRQPVAAFSILAFFVASAPTNNVLLEHASTFGERFMFISTIPFCLLLTFLVSLACRYDRSSVSGNGWRKFRMFLGVILLLYSGMTWSASGYWKDNLTLFERGVITSPNSARTHYAYASECMTRSYTEGDPIKRNAWLSKSREHFNRCLEIFPDNHEALYNTGICMALSGDSLASVRAYTKAISLNGSLVNAMNNLGVLYEAMQKPDSAIRYYTMAMKVRPEERIAGDNLSNLYYKQGLLFAQQGEKTKAIESYRTSTVYNTGNIMSLNNMASLYAGMQSYDSALVYLMKAQTLDPGNQMLVENIAAVSFLNKQYEQAIRFAELALSRNPSSRKSLGVMADTYAAMGKHEESARYRRMQSEVR
jgi:tetratricopeptide (TPR) repeat protein